MPGLMARPCLDAQGPAVFEPANIRFYSFNEIGALSRLGDDLDEAAADDRRIGKPSDLTDMFRRRDSKPERNRQRRDATHASGELLSAVGDLRRACR